MTDPRTVALDDGRTRVTFDAATGTLTGLAGASGWNVVARPGLGSAFRLLVPLDGREPSPSEYGSRLPRRQAAQPCSMSEKSPVNGVPVATRCWKNSPATGVATAADASS